MTPSTPNIQRNSQPSYNNVGGIENGFRIEPYIGCFIRKIRSCSVYIMPSTQGAQRHEQTENAEGTRRNVQAGFSLLEKIKHYSSDFVYSPVNYMIVNAQPNEIETHTFQTKFNALFHYLGESAQLLSIVSFWNFFCSLNPNYVAPKNADLTITNEQAAAQDSFSIGHFVALICSQVSRRSTLPTEMHWLLDGVSNYVMVCSNIKTAQNIYSAFKEKYNAIAPVNNKHDVAQENEKIDDNIPNLISNKIQQLKRSVDTPSNYILDSYNLLFNQSIAKAKSGSELLLLLSELSEALITVNQKLDILKTRYQPWLTQNETFKDENVLIDLKARLHLYPEYTQLAIIEKQLNEITSQAINLHETISFSLSEIASFGNSPILDADDFIHGSVSDDEASESMPELED